MKNTCFLILTALLFLVLTGSVVMANCPDGVGFVGDGTEAEPCQVRTPEQLDAIRDELDSHYKQMEDIDLDVVPYNQDPGWEPIGDWFVATFDGTFDGGGYSITGLFINSQNDDDQGLFGATEGATIKNVHLHAVNITGQDYVGGLVGYQWGGTVSDCSVEGNVEGTNSVGGLVGGLSSQEIVVEPDQTCYVEKSRANVNVKGVGEYVSIGGLVGSNTGCIVRQSFATGDVSAENEEGSRNSVGGLVGMNTYGRVQESYATGNVTGYSSVGGLVGGASGGRADQTIINSYARGNVTGNTDIGGLVGYNNEELVKNCYATGAVRGGSGVTFGGLVGTHEKGDDEIEVTDSFYDQETTGRNDIGKGTRKSTTEMKSFATFDDPATDGLNTRWPIVDGWDQFQSDTHVWGICEPENEGYPFLLWQYTSDPCSSPGPHPPHSIPTMSQWGLITLSGLMLLIGMRTYRRRKGMP